MIYKVTKTTTDINGLQHDTVIYTGTELSHAIAEMAKRTVAVVRSDIQNAKGNTVIEKIENAWRCGENGEKIDTITEVVKIYTAGDDEATLTLTREYEDEEYADRIASIKDIMRQAYMDAGFTMGEANDRINSDGGNQYIWLSMAQFDDLDNIANEMAGFARDEYENRDC